jgi:hypothetical protein
MSDRPLLGSTSETVQYHAKIGADKLYTGVVSKVDSETYKMQVQILRGSEGTQERTVPFNNLMTNYGAGFKLIPLSGRTVATFRENFGGKYEHVSYATEQIVTITDNISGSKQDSTTKLLQRNLEEGDVQIAGTLGSEIYMPVDGTVLIKNGFGEFLKLDNILNRLEGSFTNLKLDMDSVRIRAGNVIRPTRATTTEDQYMLLDATETVKGQDLFTAEELSLPYSAIPEFTVQVGIFPNPVDYVDDEPDNSPSIGKFSIAERIVDERGSALYSSGKAIQCQLRMKNGGGFSITEDGAFYVEDFNNYSPVKFDNSETSAERSLRVKKSYISVSTTNDTSATYKQELLMHDESGTEVSIRNGVIALLDYSMRGIIIDPNKGIDFNAPKSYVSIHAQDINIIPDGGKMNIGADLTALPDQLLKLYGTALWFNIHTHAGPVGPPLPTFWPINQPTLSVPPYNIASMYLTAI